MRTDFGALFDHRNHQVRLELLEANGTGQTGGACPDDDHVVFHDLTFSRCFAHQNSLEFLHQRVSISTNPAALNASVSIRPDRPLKNHFRTRNLAAGHPDNALLANPGAC